jgi:hypothetical protein
MLSSNQVPHTDAEVKEKFSEYQDSILRSCLIGIFECKRGMGATVDEAYLYTLLAHVGEKGK